MAMLCEDDGDPFLMTNMDYPHNEVQHRLSDLAKIVLHVDDQKGGLSGVNPRPPCSVMFQFSEDLLQIGSKSIVRHLVPYWLHIIDAIVTSLFRLGTFLSPHLTEREGEWQFKI